MLYKNPADRIDEFVRKARRVERILRRKDDSFLDVNFAIAKMEEIIAFAEPIRISSELNIRIPALPRPTIEELRKRYPSIRESNGIEKDVSPTEEVILHLGSVMRDGEKTISGDEYERRLQSEQFMLLGYQHAKWLVNCQTDHPAFMALLSKVYIDFPGIVVIDQNNRRFVPYLRQKGCYWGIHWNWLGDNVERFVRIAVSKKPMRKLF